MCRGKGIEGTGNREQGVKLRGRNGRNEGERCTEIGLDAARMMGEEMITGDGQVSGEREKSIRKLDYYLCKNGEGEVMIVREESSGEEGNMRGEGCVRGDGSK